MQSGWVRWIAFLMLAALVFVSSCRAWSGGGAEAAAPVAAHHSALPSGEAGEATI